MATHATILLAMAQVAVAQEQQLKALKDVRRAIIAAQLLLRDAADDIVTFSADDRAIFRQRMIMHESILSAMKLGGID